MRHNEFVSGEAAVTSHTGLAHVRRLRGIRTGDCHSTASVSWNVIAFDHGVTGVACAHLDQRAGEGGWTGGVQLYKTESCGGWARIVEGGRVYRRGWAHMLYRRG